MVPVFLSSIDGGHDLRISVKIAVSRKNPEEQIFSGAVLKSFARSDRVSLSGFSPIGMIVFVFDSIKGFHIDSG
mgnify:FL=1